LRGQCAAGRKKGTERSAERGSRFAHSLSDSGEIDRVRTLTIEAASLQTARGFYRALGDFGVELEEIDGSYILRIHIQRDHEIIQLLRVLERHIEMRGPL
jgi:hypothetical protein